MYKILEFSDLLYTGSMNKCNRKGAGKVNLKKVQYLIYALAAACVLMILLLAITKSMVFLWLMLVFAVACIAANLALWRCPYCGGHLGRDVPKFCSNCGHKLEDLQ